LQAALLGAGALQVDALADRFDLAAKKLLAARHPAVQRNLQAEAQASWAGLAALRLRLCPVPPSNGSVH
jgi:hypothetical protein